MPHEQTQQNNEYSIATISKQDKKLYIIDDIHFLNSIAQKKWSRRTHDYIWCHKPIQQYTP